MRAWPLLLLSLLAVAAACEDRCGKDVNTGGAPGSFDVAVHVHIASPSELLGQSALPELAELLALDPVVVAQTEASRSAEVLVGVGKNGVEVDTAMVAKAGAQEQLAKRYAIEPLLLKQARIKPPKGRAQCLFIRDHIACVSGSSKLGGGTFTAQQWATAGDAGAPDGQALTLRVLKPDVFAKQIWPAARANVERALTKAQTSGRVRELVLGHWDAVGQLIARAHVTGEVDGERIRLQVALPMAVPAGWSTRAAAPTLSPTPGFVALSWYGQAIEDRPELKAFAGYLDKGMARVLRIRDGAEVSLYALRDEAAAKERATLISPTTTQVGLFPGVLTLTKTQGVAEAAAGLELAAAFGQEVANAYVDLAVVGGEGDVAVSLLRGATEEQMVVKLTMSRGAFRSLWRVLGGS